MPQGLEVYDANGVLVIGITDRLQRVLGSVYTGTGAGSLTVPGFASGVPFYFVRRDGNLDSINTLQPKNVTVQGNTLSWSADGQALTILYGVY